MPPADDLETGMIDQRGPRPATLDRAFRQRGGDIQPGQRIGGRGDRLAPVQRSGSQIFEVRGFRRQRMRARLRHLGRDLVQIGRVEAHRPGHRLAVDKAAFGFHQSIGILRCDLDMIAEHAVMLDLQRGDTGTRAIVRLQRGDGTPAPCPRIAQIIERSVIALRDIAALHRIDRRRWHQSAGQQVDQCPVTAQLRGECGEQRRWRCHAIQPLAQPLTQPPRAVETIAQLPEIARAPPPRREPPERPSDIGEPPQRGAQGIAQMRILGEQLHQIEPRLDSVSGHQWRPDIRRQQPRPAAGDGAIDRVEQTALARALRGLGQLQALARGGVDRHRLGCVRDARRAQKRQRSLGGVIQIRDQPARRREARPAELAEAIERSHAVQIFDPPFRCPAVEVTLGPQHRRGLGKRTRLGRDRLRWRQAREFRAQARRAAFDQFEPPGRYVSGGNRHTARCFTHRDAPVRRARIEQRLLGQRPRRYHPNDRAADQRLAAVIFGALLGFRRTFDLFGDGDAVPGLDQPGEIPLCRMHRHAAHRDRHAIMLAPRGERDIEARRGDLRILEEHLEEIAHPVEQQTILRFGLQREILRHHRGGNRRSRNQGHLLRLRRASRSRNGRYGIRQSGSIIAHSNLKERRAPKGSAREEANVRRYQPAILRARGAAVPFGGASRQDRDHRLQADGDAARPGAGLFARRRGAGAGDRRRSRLCL